MTTQNLGLIIPSITDEIHQTITDLGTNFEKLDQAAELYASSIPTNGDWLRQQRVWNSNPVSAAYVGWVVVRPGKAAAKWSSLYPTIIGDYIVPLGDNGHIYQCIQGGHSGVSEPSFPTVANATVDDTKNGSTWVAGHEYQLNDIVFPSLENDSFYVCEIPGTSGTVEPNWSAASGDPNTDNVIRWRTYRTVKWKEVGAAVLFKGFGMIE